MKFREQRGSLNDSMRTCVELKDHAALVEHCRKLLEAWPTAPQVTNNTLWVEKYTDLPDERIGWGKTYIVGVYGYGVLGYTDAPCADKERASIRAAADKAGCPWCGARYTLRSDGKLPFHGDINGVCFGSNKDLSAKP